MFEHQKKYFSFYSTYNDLITTDPEKMLIPLDDHGFHRGDGVFEAIKWIDRKPWILDKHLERLLLSAESIGIKSPMGKMEISQKISELIQMSNQLQGMIRIFLTRGPGSFGVSPSDTIGSQIYIVTTELKQVSEKVIREGVRVGWSQIPAKVGIFPKAKSLNYLPNVLMKKECEDRGLDYVIGCTTVGFLTESYTENLFFIHGKTLIHPKFDYILKGTTLLRFIELVQNSEKARSIINNFQSRDITQEEALGFDYLFSIGTTIDLQWANSLEQKTYSKPHFYEELRGLLITDQKNKNS